MDYKQEYINEINQILKDLDEHFLYLVLVFAARLSK